MKSKIIGRTVGCAVLLVMSAGMACNTSTGPKAATGAMAVLQPTAGQTFKVGDTIKVKWTVRYPDSISSIIVALYHLPDAVPITLGSNSFAYPDTTFSWVADSAAVSGHCYIKLQEYFNNVVPDSSGTFSITY